eukprot:m.1171281 g.1171281  ORF g.1171281 m.1171281 type:complete len:107 (-) comp24514_c0_seq3:4650-4970(-)
MASSCGVHDVAVQGYNDTKAADLYAAARPGYSEEAVTRVLRETNTLHRDGWGLRTNTTVLDLGAGTGKMTYGLHWATCLCNIRSASLVLCYTPQILKIVFICTLHP